MKLVTRFINFLSKEINQYDLNLTHQLYKNATLETIKFIRSNNIKLLSLYDKTDLYKKLKGKVDGDILEFGVYQGRSINQFAKLFPDKRIFGFDSFTGLPEDWSVLPKGAFNLNGIKPPVEKNVTLISGLIETTLKEFIKTYNGKIGLLHIDVDIFSTTKSILDLLGEYLDDAYIIFDEYWNYPDWQNGEYLAFQNFIKNNGRSFSYIGHDKKSTVLVHLESKRQSSTKVN